MNYDFGLLHKYIKEGSIFWKGGFCGSWFGMLPNGKEKELHQEKEIVANILAYKPYPEQWAKVNNWIRH